MAKKKTTRRRTVKEAAPEHEVPGGFWRQVGAVLMLAIAVVLIMTWFGAGGDLLVDIQNGLIFGIGFAAYLIPVLLVYLAVKIFTSENNQLPGVVWVASMLMVIWCSGIFGIPTIGNENPTGGVVGAALNGMVVHLLNAGAAVFIYLVLIFITALFILQMNPSTAFKAIKKMMFGVKSEEDTANERVIKKTKSNKGEMDLVINNGQQDEEEKTSSKAPALKIRTSKPATPAAPSPEPERALVSLSDPNWKMPSITLFEKKQSPADSGDINQNAQVIRSTLEDFGINVEMEGANVGPCVTQYTMKPPAGVNLSKILARDKELALNLGTNSIRIEAPIPGTRLVGVEMPNVKAEVVRLRSILESKEWKESTEPLTFAVGKDISGKAVVGNLAKMPHLLVAGTTGSGKSVMTNTLISSLIYRNAPSDMKLIIVDPKQVEMAQYNDIPHLLTPIITQVDKAVSAVSWAVNEMERRYTLMAEEKVKTIVDYNKKMEKKAKEAPKEDVSEDEQKQDTGKMPYIVVIIDEMADLMMMAGKDLEKLIVRIAQKGRASGIHLVLATQRPEVKVITGLIKANVPGRIAFAVSNQMDSRIMLDMGGAEKLLGRGDMLMLTTEMMGKPRRIQGAWSPDEDINKLADFLREQRSPEYNNEVISQAVNIKGLGPSDGGSIGDLGRKYDPNDPLVRKAVELAIMKGKFSTSMLQTYLGKGHGFVSGLAVWFEEVGVIGAANGNKPRDVLISSLEEFDALVADL